ncbi:MAG: nitrilase-related carbon-nitrogen hydrolase [Alphaproteobacteria bacterium]
MRVATTRYPLEIHDSIDQAFERLKELCKKACNVDFLVLPEYAGLEWVWPYKKSFQENVEFFQTSGIEAYKNALVELAKGHNMTIIGGSVPVYDTQYYNRCYVACPSGKLLWQDKIHLTPSEKALGWLNGSNTLKIFDSDFGKFGVCICYDSEFPELVSQLTFAGTDVLFIPSYTDSAHGAQRIHVAAHARAMENQCFAITATCTGKAIRGDFSCDEFDGIATGEAGIFTPIDAGFPESGILAKTESNTLIMGDLDLELMLKVRFSGQVLNFSDRTNAQSILLEKEQL